MFALKIPSNRDVPKQLTATSSSTEPASVRTTSPTRRQVHATTQVRPSASISFDELRQRLPPTDGLLQAFEALAPSRRKSSTEVGPSVGPSTKSESSSPTKRRKIAEDIPDDIALDDPRLLRALQEFLPKQDGEEASAEF